MDRPRNNLTEYGPRWTDYEGWGKLELGMSKQEVIQTLGEPYMPLQGISLSDLKTQILIFKIRIKYYSISEEVRTKKTVTSVNGPTTYDISTWKNKKPEKSANTNVWGDESFNLYCTFENGKLARWVCPESIPQRKQVVDSLLLH